MNKKTPIIDDAFDIEPSGFNSIIEFNDGKNLPVIHENIEHTEYDDKDKEIETQFQDIYNKAIDAFDTQVDATEDIEGKYLARNSEVANQLLNTALAAAKEKSNLKKHSDHLRTKKANNNPETPGGTTNIQNNIVMDRNELLKIMNGE